MADSGSNPQPLRGTLSVRLEPVRKRHSQRPGRQGFEPALHNAQKLVLHLCRTDLPAAIVAPCRAHQMLGTIPLVTEPFQ